LTGCKVGNQGLINKINLNYRKIKVQAQELTLMLPLSNDSNV